MYEYICIYIYTCMYVYLHRYTCIYIRVLQFAGVPVIALTATATPRVRETEMCRSTDDTDTVMSIVTDDTETVCAEVPMIPKPSTDDTKTVTGVAVIALTATATPRVREDIVQTLKMRNPKKYGTRACTQHWRLEMS